MEKPIHIEDFVAQARREGRLIRLQRLEMLGSLTSGFAHDLNNLLFALQSYLTGIRLAANERACDEALAGDIDSALAVARRAADLVRSMVRFSRQSGAHTDSVHVAALIEEVFALLRGSLPTSIQIKNSITGLDIAVVGEATQLIQVFMNLCLNARDAMPDGGELILSLERVHIDEESASGGQLEAGDYVRIEVRDTGMGIEEQHREKIFEPFFTTKENGNGVGLFIVQEILRAHRGDIRMEKSSGSGTRFSVYLPQA